MTASPLSTRTVSPLLPFVFRKSPDVISSPRSWVLSMTMNELGDSGVLHPIKRSATLPAKLISQSARASATTLPDNVIFYHPSCRIVQFAPRSFAPIPSASSPSDFDYPVDTVETLPWRSASERTLATASLRIEKVHGLTVFLKCGSIVQPILKNSQCWCVDGVSKFVLRIRPLFYYRIEIPYETPEDKGVVEQLKAALPTVLRYEVTPCPFKRAFTVELPEEATAPRRKKAWRPKDRKDSLTVSSGNLQVPVVDNKLDTSDSAGDDTDGATTDDSAVTPKRANSVSSEASPPEIRSLEPPINVKPARRSVSETPQTFHSLRAKFEATSVPEEPLAELGPGSEHPPKGEQVAKASTNETKGEYYYTCTVETPPSVIVSQEPNTEFQETENKTKPIEAPSAEPALAAVAGKSTNTENSRKPTKAPETQPVEHVQESIPTEEQIAQPIDNKTLEMPPGLSNTHTAVAPEGVGPICTGDETRSTEGLCTEDVVEPGFSAKPATDVNPVQLDRGLTEVNISSQSDINSVDEPVVEQSEISIEVPKGAPEPQLTSNESDAGAGEALDLKEEVTGMSKITSKDVPCGDSQTTFGLGLQLPSEPEADKDASFSSSPESFHSADFLSPTESISTHSSPIQKYRELNGSPVMGEIKPAFPIPANEPSKAGPVMPGTINEVITDSSSSPTTESKSGLDSATSDALESNPQSSLTVPPSAREPSNITLKNPATVTDFDHMSTEFRRRAQATRQRDVSPMPPPSAIYQPKPGDEAASFITRALTLVLVPPITLFVVLLHITARIVISPAVKPSSNSHSTPQTAGQSPPIDDFSFPLEREISDYEDAEATSTSDPWDLD